MVTAEVASVDGKEDYRNIMLNGRPSKRPIEKTGAWSTGEFQTTLASLLNPYTAAAFHKTRDDTLGGRSAYSYDFQVQQRNSNWDIHAPDGSVATPAYSGTVWIDKATFNVMRIEEQTGPLPTSFPFDKAESVVEYGFMNIDGKTYPLPVHSEILTCQRGTPSARRTRFVSRITGSSVRIRTSRLTSNRNWIEPAHGTGTCGYPVASCNQVPM